MLLIALHNLIGKPGLFLCSKPLPQNKPQTCKLLAVQQASAHPHFITKSSDSLCGIT